MKQLSLWQEKTQETHHLIELHYADGTRRIVDTANPEHAAAFRDMMVLYAGFVTQDYQKQQEDA